MRGAVAVVQFDDPMSADALWPAVVTRVESWRRKLSEPSMSIATRWLPALRTGIVVLGDGSANDVTDTVVWGRPLTPHDGPSVASAIDRPEVEARQLWGHFLLTRVDERQVRLVTSGSLVHVLKRVRHDGMTAWSTRGGLAHVLVDAPGRLNRDAIAEYVLFDYVMRDDELLTDTVVLPDALVVDITAAGATERSYWPLADRFSQGSPTTATGLRVALRGAAAAYAAASDVSLGLTAGRDSTLLASVVHEIGGRLDTFTFGLRWFSDPRGARDVAAQLRWPHTTVVPRHSGDQTWDSMAALSLWSEGLITGSDLRRDEFRWGALDRTWLSGSGGELGRTFYGPHAKSAADWVDSLEEGLRHSMTQSAVDTLISRLRADVHAAAALGRPAVDTLSLFYATGRMRKWLARLMPSPQIAHTCAGYLVPEVWRALLDIPPDRRRDGSTFSEALTLGGDHLHDVAERAVRPSGAMHRVDRVRFRRLDQVRTRQLLALLATAPTGVVRQTLGDRWWQRLLDEIPHQAAARRRGWNVVAVEAFAHSL